MTLCTGLPSGRSAVGKLETQSPKPVHRVHRCLGTRQHVPCVHPTPSCSIPARFHPSFRGVTRTRTTLSKSMAAAAEAEISEEHVHLEMARSGIWNLGKKKSRNLHPVIVGLPRRTFLKNVWVVVLCAVSSY
uniref:HDC09478 n=1 Tax=Drosophila melanogaster TaxID=7227 RepID=Q6ILG7_DROME|nr:TPA_inf: HDC09478 [Drosophila melanogaster]